MLLAIMLCTVKRDNILSVSWQKLAWPGPASQPKPSRDILPQELCGVETSTCACVIIINDIIVCCRFRDGGQEQPQHGLSFSLCRCLYYLCVSSLSPCL